MADSSAQKPVENAWSQPETAEEPKCHDRKIAAVESDIRPSQVTTHNGLCIY